MFLINHKSKGYMVTAKHIVGDDFSGGKIKLFNDGEWKTVNVNVVAMGEYDVDFAVLSTEQFPIPEGTPEANQDKMVLGGNCYLVGFPYDVIQKGTAQSLDFPLPILRRGILASGTTEGRSFQLVDVSSLPGFSGGPVVFHPYDDTSKAMQIAGVIGQRLGYNVPVKVDNGVGPETTDYFIDLSDVGFTCFYPINFVTDAIHRS